MIEIETQGGLPAVSGTLLAKSSKPLAPPMRVPRMLSEHRRDAFAQGGQGSQLQAQLACGKAYSIESYEACEVASYHTHSELPEPDPARRFR